MDFFGDVFISDSVELRAGKAELTFGHTFTAAIGGRARARAIAALLNSNPDGVTPHINISVLHDAEHRALVGKAKIDLLSILKSGKELKEMVLLLEHETGGEIGDVVCSLESLRTLRVLSEVLLSAKLSALCRARMKSSFCMYEHDGRARLRKQRRLVESSSTSKR